MVGLDGVDAYQLGFTRFSAIRSNGQASSDVGAKSF
jgi:hypothetical protein